MRKIINNNQHKFVMGGDTLLTKIPSFSHIKALEGVGLSCAFLCYKEGEE